MPDYSAYNAAVFAKDWRGLQRAVTALGRPAWDQWASAMGAAGNEIKHPFGTIDEQWRKNRWDILPGVTSTLGWGATGGSGGSDGTEGTGGAGGTSQPPTGVPAPQMDMGWLNQGSLGGMLQGGQQASSQALPGLLNQPTQQGLLGGSPFYGSIPWGMMPQDIRTLMNSQAKRSLAQAPSKTTG